MLKELKYSMTNLWNNTKSDLAGENGKGMLYSRLIKIAIAAVLGGIFLLGIKAMLLALPIGITVGVLVGAAIRGLPVKQQAEEMFGFLLAKVNDVSHMINHFATKYLAGEQHAIPLSDSRVAHSFSEAMSALKDVVVVGCKEAISGVKAWFKPKTSPDVGGNATSSSTVATRTSVMSRVNGSDNGEPHTLENNSEPLCDL